MSTIIITGGIGSGKSFILKYIKKLGYSVFQTDITAKDFMQSDSFIKAIQKYLNITEHLNLEIIKQYIIQNHSLLEFIESIVHPEVQKIRNEWINTNVNKYPFVFVEVPLFFEKKLRNIFDQCGELIVVSTLCGIQKQIYRAKKRDNTVSDEILKIILAKQCSDHERVAGSNIIIYTCGSKNSVKKQVKKFLRSLTNKNE